jgi:transcriptional regulator with XRE-family HTH domain
MSILSERLRKLRLKHKLTQKQVADYLGISESGYGYYEQGRNEPSLKALKLLATKYNVSVAYLTGETDDPQPQLTAKDERDIAKRMEKMKKDLLRGSANGEGLSFMGEPMSPEAIDSLLEALEHAERIATIANKKYTPKKYRDKE